MLATVFSNAVGIVVPLYYTEGNRVTVAAFFVFPSNFLVYIYCSSYFHFYKLKGLLDVCLDGV